MYRSNSCARVCVGGSDPYNTLSMLPVGYRGACIGVLANMPREWQYFRLMRR